MPNHITTIIHIEPKDSEDEDNWESSHKKLCNLYKNLKTKESDFDFNAVIPAPDNIEKGNCSGEHKDGEVCWYVWKNANWGTKWNAHDVRYLSDSYDEDNTVYEILVKIETAWSPPMPVLHELAKKFRVRYTWKDEGSDNWNNWQEA